MYNFEPSMGKVSINFELKSEPSKRGTYAIMLRVTENKRHKRCTTTVEVPRKSDWDSRKQQVRSTAPFADRLNDELDEIRRQAIETYRDLKEEGIASESSVIRELKRNSEVHTLLDFCKERMEEMNRERKFGSFKKYGDAVNKIKGFLATRHEEDILVGEVDERFVEAYRLYLLSLPNQRYKDGTTLGENSVIKQLKILKALLNNAKEKGYAQTNPMANLHLKEVHTVSRHLSDEELLKLRTAEFSPESPGLNNGRNLYMFSIYAAGMRMSDVLMLRWNNITNKGGQMRLQYIMSKTGKPVDLVLVEEAQRILKQYKSRDTKEVDYVFPYLDDDADYARYKDYTSIMQMPRELHKKLFNAINAEEVVVNKQLKKVADMLGMEPFSFHSARRDFGRLAYDSGVKALQIQDLLNHENIATTERYMRRLDTSAADEALEQTFSTESKERRAKVLVRELKKLGFGKSDVKRLFDEIAKKN